ncbi:MAG TPA: hypothetical protein VMB81_21660 [Candidatus Sulfotelmatobacter sp.]|nr:hypothetical protein [Candidatus Sulfotelmatobacter sp.]
MPYFVKWQLHGRDTVLSSKTAYAEQAAAMDFACGALSQKPRDIWIEDERGKRVGDELQIIRHCTKPVKVTAVRPPARRRSRTTAG